MRRTLAMLLSKFPNASGMSVDLVISIALAVGLAAAVGFRVFLPLLVVSAAACTGHLELSDSFAWLGTPAALAMLGIAAVVEILAYYIPGVDNLLDLLATPAALVAGIVISAAVMVDLPPMLKWAAAIIAGGGAAGLTQSVTAVLRTKSTALTGGFANPVLATAEFSGALLVSLLAVLAPLAAIALIVVFCWVAVRFVRKVRNRGAQGGR